MDPERFMITKVIMWTYPENVESSPVQSLICFSPNIDFNIILPSMPRQPMWFLSMKCFRWSFVCIYLHLVKCHVGVPWTVPACLIKSPAIICSDYMHSTGVGEVAAKARRLFHFAPARPQFRRPTYILFLAIIQRDFWLPRKDALFSCCNITVRWEWWFIWLSPNYISYTAPNEKLIEINLEII